MSFLKFLLPSLGGFWNSIVIMLLSKSFVDVYGTCYFLLFPSAVIVELSMYFWVVHAHIFGLRGTSARLSQPLTSVLMSLSVEM